LAGFPPLLSFVMVMFQERLFTRLRSLNPDSPGASTTFLANFHFVPGSFPVGCQN